MIAILALILAAIAGLLKLLHSHGSWVIPLMIIALILVCGEVAFGWYRGGRYRRDGR